MQFVELPGFSLKAAKGLKDAGLEQLHTTLSEQPDSGVLLPRGGGLRCLFFTPRRRGRPVELGVLYFHRVGSNEICLLDLLARGVKAPFSVQELANLGKVLSQQPAAFLPPLAQEYADVRTGRIAPGAVWLVTRLGDDTIEREPVSPEKYQRVQQVLHGPPSE